MGRKAQKKSTSRVIPTDQLASLYSNRKLRRKLEADLRRMKKGKRRA